MPPTLEDLPTAPADHETLSQALLESVEAGRGNAMRFHQDGRWRTLSFAQLAQDARRLARGLIAVGVEPGDRVAILSATRREWTLADLAVLWAGAVAVPVYHTNSPDECRHVLQDSGARVVFCEDSEQLAKLAEVDEGLPQLQHIVNFTDSGEAALSLEELGRRGDEVEPGEVDARVSALSRDDAATIVYTSGTTGAPKGCVLTHGNIRSNIEMVERRVDFGDDPKVFYLWLPLAHVLARVVQYIAIHQGAELGYWRGDPKQLPDDVAELQPTHLPSVPRVFEKIYTAARSGAEESALKARLLDWAVGVGGRFRQAREDGQRIDPLLAAQHRLADRLVLRRIRGLFGSRLRLAVTGAAPVEPDILRFFHAAGVYVLEGYGMTEATAVATLNTVEEHRFGTVGRPVPGCEIRVAEDGELLIRGPNVFAGYFGHEEDTAGVLVDGWLHTGDLGAIDADGYVTITGRKKEIIITSSGKNVTPASIENALKQCRWISQAVVYGDRRPYLTALITLDPAEAPALAGKLGVPDDLATMAVDERVRAEIRRAVDDVNSRFATIEQVKRFIVLERDLSEEEDELTPTAKVKRAVVYDRHGDRLGALYDEPR